MTNDDRLPSLLLKRKAVVHVRQSTQTQVRMNLESERRQYDLAQEARRRESMTSNLSTAIWGAASGTVARPGFERLVALLVPMLIALSLRLLGSR